MPAVGGTLLAGDRSAATTRVEDRAQTPVEPPAALLLLSGAVVAAGTAMVLVGAVRTGVSWDEPFHVMRLRNQLDHGWYAVDWSVASGGSTDGESNTLVYGPVTMLLLHGLGVLAGTEGWSTVATTPAAYAVRHLGVAALGLVGTAAAAATTRLVLGSWRWALVTAAVLLALPMWAGHAMFNVKDVPVATGYTLLTLGLVAVAGRHGTPAARVAGLVAGAVLMVGTRPGMVAAAAAGAAVLLAGLAATRRPVRPAAAEVGVAAAVTAALLAWVYPGVFAHPWRLVTSAEQSASFRSGGAGVWYVPYHLATQFPLLLQAAFVIGLVQVVRYAARRRSDPVRAVGVALVATQLVALPAVAVVKDSELYNGLRQLLFVAPAWAVVTTLGGAAAWGWARTLGRRRLVGGLTAVALVAPVVDQVTLFPYQYTYWNATLDLVGARPDTDYWRTSVPELLDRIPTDGPVVCSPTRSTVDGATAGSPGARGVPETAMVANRYSADTSQDCRTDPLGPLVPLWRAEGRAYGDTLPVGDFYAVVDRDHALPENCTELAAVTRPRHGREVAMTYVARCHLDPPALDQPVAFFHFPLDYMAPRAWSFLPLGWQMRDSAGAVDSTGTQAALTFRAPASCATGCTVHVAADHPPSDLTASLNGAPASLTEDDGDLALALPPGTSDAWVVLTRTSGAPLGLRIRSIHVTPPGVG